MKKMLIKVLALVFISQTVFAQSSGGDAKKVRAGIRITPQPTWFASGNGNTTKEKSGFGFGFGLNLDFRLTDVLYFSSGIGGDFEGGTMKYRDDGFNPTASGSGTVFVCSYVQNSSGDFIEAENGVDFGEYFKVGNSAYYVKERKIKTTHVTIPITLKMLTNEYSGFKYYGQFGGELGIRTAIKATDEYSWVQTVTNATLVTVTQGGSNSNLSIGKDAALVPIRLGLNIGAGAEYRLGGSTSAFLSINYFRSFTNLMRGDSKFITTGGTTDASTNKITFTHLQQDLRMSAIRINIGFMF